MFLNIKEKKVSTEYNVVLFTVCINFKNTLANRKQNVVVCQNQDTI